VTAGTEEAQGMGKNVMITGAGSGFGKGAALALAARRHSVIATSGPKPRS
jgi:NAD(P)-dependent dehydrogenase (short-subunit alcohol dehydrogenase family)